MHDPRAFLENLALIFCIGAITTVVFQRLRQPVVFGYLIAGMIVGPYLPTPLAADAETVRTLSELGVILLMFSLGLEFRLRRVVEIAGTSGLAALAETSLMLAAGFAISEALGWTRVEGLFTGAMVAISSTTIVAKSFAGLRISTRTRDIVFGILVVEDLIAILLVALLSAVAAGGGLSAGLLATTSLRLGMFLLLLLGVGALIVPRLMRHVTRVGSNETMLVTSVGICFAAALVALTFGYSVALGAFIAGSLVAESGESKRVEPLIEPVRDIFLAIFFVSVGMLIEPAVIRDHWLEVLVLTSLVIVGKFVFVTIGAFFTGGGIASSIEAGMSLGQIGEFSFIIAAIGTSTGIIRPSIYSVAIAASALTTLTTPLLVRSARPLASWIDRKLPHSIQTTAALYESWVERLRSGGRSGGGRARIKRLIRLMVLDTIILALLIVGAGLEIDRFAAALEGLLAWPPTLARIATIAGVTVVAIPLVAGLVRLSFRLSMALAIRALPADDRRVDFARAPRTAFVATLQAALLLAALAPIIAVAQPIIRAAPLGVVVAVTMIVLAAAFWRAARDLHGHARAGAEVIVSTLASQMDQDDEADDLALSMEQVNTVIPGLGEPVPIRLSGSSPAVGRTLREINLRGVTGATVLAIVRGHGDASQVVVPSGNEKLRGGDVLAVAGSRVAVAAARELLVSLTPSTAAVEA
jgi:CPA2 family monovalent cation:H+ antiporter-2